MRIEPGPLTDNRTMRKSSLVCGIAAGLPLVILVLAVAGCGSNAPTTSSETPSHPNTSTETPPAIADGHRAPLAGSNAQGASSTASRVAAIRRVLDYGSAAGPAQRSAVRAAAAGFFTALASRDYAAVCTGLGAGNREQLQGLLQLKHVQASGCPGVLRKLLVSQRIAANAAKAAHAKLQSVRIRGVVAYIIYQPAGGPRSYFVMKREKGAWKATSMAPGFPLRPR